MKNERRLMPQLFECQILTSEILYTHIYFVISMQLVSCAAEGAIPAMDLCH